MDKNGLWVLGTISLTVAMLVGCSESKVSETAPDAAGGASTLAGTWDGYAETAAFVPDGSDRVRVMIDANGNATLEIGNEPTLSPPTDPNVGYPPTLTAPGQELDLSSALFEGFLYPSHAASISADRIQLGINPFDVWGTWCALQTPVVAHEIGLPDGGTQAFYSCVPFGIVEQGPGGGPDGGPDSGTSCALSPPNGGASVPVDCAKATLCGFPVCTCSSSSCTSQSLPSDLAPNQFPFELDATLDDSGTSLTGTLGTPGSGLTTRFTVHLTRL